MEHDLNLMIRGTTFDSEPIPIGRSQGHRIDKHAIAGSELKFPRTIHFLVAGKRNSPWVKGAVLGRSRKVDHARALIDDANKEAIEPRPIPFLVKPNERTIQIPAIHRGRSLLSCPQAAGHELRGH